MKRCPQCKVENPSNATFCLYCGILLNSELPKCTKCKEEYTRAADFCLHCGYAITDKAKKEQKIVRSKKEQRLVKEIRDLQKENETLLATLNENKQKVAVELIKKGEIVEYVPVALIIALLLGIVIFIVTKFH